MAALESSENDGTYSPNMHSFAISASSLWAATDGAMLKQIGNEQFLRLGRRGHRSGDAVMFRDEDFARGPHELGDDSRAAGR